MRPVRQSRAAGYACVRPVRSRSRICKRRTVPALRQGEKVLFMLVSPTLFESQTAPFYYSGAAKRSVHALKFDGCVQNAVGLARFMSDSVKNNFAGVKFDFVCCVPLSESSFKRRGYNQSALLAKEIAKELGVPFEEKLLSRPFQGKEQKTLGGIERFGGVIGAFDCDENKITENAAVLLCDDISTTGATLNECAKLLLLRGADKVYCVSAAITKRRTENARNKHRNRPRHNFHTHLR